MHDIVTVKRPELKGQSEALEEIVQEFMDGLCPCRWIITTPEHSKKDCPHYTFAPERDFINEVFPLYAAKEIEAAKKEWFNGRAVIDIQEASAMIARAEKFAREEGYKHGRKNGYQLGYDAKNHFKGNRYEIEAKSEGIQAEKLRILKVIDEKSAERDNQKNHPLVSYRDVVDEIKKVIEATE